LSAGEQAVRCLVKGRVQGVWYRATAEKKAQRLNLRGWARNLPDGEVEVVVAGPPGVVAEFCGCLWEGPAGASVTGVTVSEWTEEVSPGFDAT
jgi:acylphosphatase